MENKDQIDDIEYFLKRAITCFNNKDMDGLKKCVRQLHLMFDALIIYRLHRGELKDANLL